MVLASKGGEGKGGEGKGGEEVSKVGTTTQDKTSRHVRPPSQLSLTSSKT